eukprot:Em0019g694a
MANLSGEGVGPVPVNTTLSPQDVLRACSFFARSESLRSLELPLEHLLSGVVFLSGGRDKRGSPILSITQPDDIPLETLMEMTPDDVINMLSYFTSVPKDDARTRGFCVLLSAESIHDFLLRTVVKALNTLQHTHVQLFKTVFFVSATRNSTAIEQIKDGREGVDLPMIYMKSNVELFSYIDQNQLSKEFGGTLEYSHQDWVKFRLRVEPFICDCLSISKRLAVAMEPLLDDWVPRTIEEAEQSIAQCKTKRQKMLDSLHIEELTAEGKIIDEQMSLSFSMLRDNPEFNSTLAVVQKLVDQISSIKNKLDILWNSYYMRLETNLKKLKFEKDTEQIVEWFVECADEFLVAHADMGESLEVAEAMQQEVDNFERDTQQILTRAEEVLKCGSDLKSRYPEVRARIEKIERLISGFTTRLNQLKKQLAESVRLHKLTQEAFGWCVRGMEMCSDYDLLSAQLDTLDPSEVKKRFSEFLSQDSTFTAAQLQELTELAERTSNPSTKENAIFASNRVMEMAERLAYYQMILDKMAEEKRQRVEQEASNKQQLLQQALGLAEAMDVLVGVAVGMPSDVQQLPLVKEPLPLSSSVQVSCVSNEEVDTALELLEKAVCVASGFNTRNEDVDSGGTKAMKAAISGPAPIEQAMDAESKMTEVPGPETVENEDWTAQTKNAKHRRHLMEELIMTEESYIQSLEHVCKHYLPLMEVGRDLPAALQGKKEAIFVNIINLLEFNRTTILPKLLECRKCPIKLGHVFLEEEESFLQYSTYFKAMPSQSRLMVETGTQFFARTQQTISDNLPLDSYLIKPFQRVTKYKLFLDDMIKHFVKSDLNGKLKECFDLLKESQKMIDFILRHGNDLLALDCLTGFQVNPSSHGMLLRQGELTYVEKGKHRRIVFLFENVIVFTKPRKAISSDPHSPDVYEFRAEYKTHEFTLRENITDHPTRFELGKKQKVIMLQALTENEKNQWVEEIRELYFSRVLQMKDTLLEAYHASPLSSIQDTSVNPLVRGSYYGHTMRRAVSVRSIAGRDLKQSSGGYTGRPYSTQSGDFVVRPTSLISQDYSMDRLSCVGLSNRSSLISTQSSYVSEACEKNDPSTIGQPVTYSPVDTQDPKQTLRTTALVNVAAERERLANSVSERSVEADDPAESSQDPDDEVCTMTVTPL